MPIPPPSLNNPILYNERKVWIAGSAVGSGFDPSDIIRTSIGALTTSAVANTTTTGSLLAAPGVGFHHRLWGASIAPANTAQAVVNWKFVLTDFTTGVGYLIWTGNNFATPGGIWIPGGVAFANNRAIGYSIQSALASLALQGYFYTTLE